MSLVPRERQLLVGALVGGGVGPVGALVVGEFVGAGGGGGAVGGVGPAEAKVVSTVYLIG